MKFNIFRNPNIDKQVKNLLDKFEDEINKQTEEYWRTVIAEEIRNVCPDFKNDGVECIDCLETIEIVFGKSYES